MEPTSSGSSIIIPLLMAAIDATGTPLTPYRPPLFNTPSYSFEQCVEELQLTPEQINIFPSSFKMNWEKSQFDAKLSLSKVDPNSIAASVIKSMEESIKNLERQLYAKFIQWLNDHIDGTDLNTLYQLRDFTQWTWSHLKHYLITTEGTHFGLVEKEDYPQAAKFSFQHMMTHYEKLTALQTLYFHQDGYFLNPLQKKTLPILLTQESETHLRWHQRWRACEKMSLLNHVLSTQLTQYEEFEKSIHKDIPFETSYPIHTQTLLLRETLVDVKSSFSNYILSLKPKSDAFKQYENLMNSKCQTFTRFMWDYQESIPFYTACDQALKVIHDSYNNLFPPFSHLQSSQELMENYINAISEDNFIKAKWLSLGHYNQEQSKTNFDWLKEAEAFENYKRRVDQLTHSQDQIDDIISELHRIIFKIQNLRGDDPQRNKSVSEHYYHAIFLIKDLWDFRKRIDNYRFSLQVSYFKELKTTRNELVPLLNRIFPSCKNKAMRLFLTGEVLDKTKTMQETQLDIIKLNEEYYILLKKLASFNDLLKKEETSHMQLTPHLLKGKPLTENDLMVFYTKSGYEDLTSTNKPNLLGKSAQYSIQRLCSLFPKSKYWTEQLEIVNNFMYCFEEITKAREIFIMYLNLPLNQYSQYQLNSIEKNLDLYRHTYLNTTLKNFILNKRTSSKKEVSQYFPDIQTNLIEKLRGFSVIFNNITDDYLSTNPQCMDKQKYLTLGGVDTYIVDIKNNAPKKSIKKNTRTNQGKEDNEKK